MVCFIALHPVQNPIWHSATCSHMEEQAAQRQLSSHPIYRAGILDFTVSLHSLTIINVNARLIKQSSQINVPNRNTQLQALHQPTHSFC